MMMNIRSDAGFIASTIILYGGENKVSDSYQLIVEPIVFKIPTTFYNGIEIPLHIS